MRQINSKKANWLLVLRSCFAVALMIVMVSCEKADEIVNNDDVVITPEITGAQAITDLMANGFNLGNTFENGIQSTQFADIKPVIDLYRKAGMKHVRIPTTWMEPTRFGGDMIASANGNINLNHVRFKELVKVIDYALRLEMYVVLNTHHEHWLKDEYDGTAEFDTKFANLWTNIAAYFKDYSHKLILEVLNEPEGKLGEKGNGWPSPTSGLALAYTRAVNNVGYNAIRASGGNNITRLIMVSVNGQGNANYIEEVYPSKASLPGGGKDVNLAIQVHSYNPWAFCGQTGSNSAFPGNSFVKSSIETVGVHSKLLNVPINYGEFGVGRVPSSWSERNTDLVRGYYKVFAETTLAQGMSYSVWDDRGWFGLISESGTSYRFTNNIVPTMLGQ